MSNSDAEKQTVRGQAGSQSEVQAQGQPQAQPAPESPDHDAALSMPGLTDTFGLTPRPRSKARLVDPLLGADLGGVTIVRLIGEGGMGRVYEAVQDRPSRTVAVKVIRPGVLSEKTLRRFEREAEFLAKLQHPGIAQIYVVGTYSSDVGEVPFYVMQHIADAKPITNFVHERRLPLADRLRLFQQVCQAVSHGHDRGVVHRDLKPGNILIDNSGQPRIIDFGVARSTDSDLAVTSMRTDTGQVVGTVQYMAPEQFGATPDDLDARADVYSLGVVLYELLAGEPPYDVRRKGIHEAARIVCEHVPAPLRSHDRGLPRDVCLIADRCLHKERKHRYYNAGELAADVTRFLDGEPISASSGNWLRFSPRSLTGRFALMLAAAIVTVGLVGAGWLGTATTWFQPVGPWSQALRVSSDWVESDLGVTKGRCYRLTATGSCADSTGAGFATAGEWVVPLQPTLGPAKDLPLGTRERAFAGQHPRRALVARIADKSWSILVGPELTFVAPATGPLAFRINEPLGSTLAPTGEVRLELEALRKPGLVTPDGAMTIRARIDDVDYLLLTPAGLQWEYGGAWSRVGMHEGIYPTFVNGIAWWPDWQDPVKSSVLAIDDPVYRAWQTRERPQIEVTAVSAPTGEVVVDTTRSPPPTVRFRDTGLGSSEVGCRLQLVPTTPAAPSR